MLIQKNKPEFLKSDDKLLRKNPSNKTIKLDILAITILFLILLDLQLFGIFGRTTFPQDPAIVFEGSYRITSHQIPFKDFFIPFGPIVFYMQAFINLILGVSVFSMAFHVFILSIILCSIFYFMIREEFGISMSLIFSIFLYLSFSGLTFHPFYNYTTYFFFFLNIFLLFYYRKNVTLPWFIYLLSALLGALDFYTKQDTGILHIFFLFIYFVYNYRKQWKSIFFYYLIPSFIFVIGTFFVLSNFLPNFTYWFNLGQSPYNSRISNFLNPEKILIILSSWKTYLSLGFLFILLFKKVKDCEKIKIMGLFLIISFTTIINNTLSGSTRQLSVMGLPILIFFTYILTKDYTKSLKEEHKIAHGIILTIILLLVLNPFPTYGLIVLNYFNPEVSHIKEGCYKGYPVSQEALEGLSEIREIIEENNQSFISMTEYTFLYCDYNLIPPKNLPLWFDEGVSFYKENVPEIVNVAKSANPKVILLQDAHGHEDRNLNDKFIESFLSLGYIKKTMINQTASGNPITILIKNE